MKTIYRDENNKLQKCLIEEKHLYHYINEELFINNKKFIIEKIILNTVTSTRIIYMKSIEDKLSSKLDWKYRKGLL